MSNESGNPPRPEATGRLAKTEPITVVEANGSDDTEKAQPEPGSGPAAAQR